jgi:hypothetical protein
MLNYMKFIDMFGTSFQFTIFKKEKFRTIVGAILTVISFVIILVFSFFFGSDFYYKLNPKVLTEIIQPEIYPPSFELSPENLVLAWRITDSSDLLINYTGIIYPVITYYNFHLNSTEQDKDRVEVLSIQKCSDLNVKMKEFVFPKDDWYCLDWSSGNYSLGGYWDANSIDYFELVLYYCPEGQPFGPENNCTDLKTMQKLVANNNLFFSLLSPNYFFLPSDIQDPLKTSFSNYYFAVSLTMQKTDRIFFQEVELDDDQGWILKIKELKKRYSMNKLTTDFSYFDINNFGLPDVPSDFYHLNFYFLKQKITIRRSFMKAQDFAAIMGGFIKTVTLIAMTISNFFNFFEREEKIYNEFFQLKKSDSSPSVERRKIKEKTSPLRQSFNEHHENEGKKGEYLTPQRKILKSSDDVKFLEDQGDGAIGNKNKKNNKNTSTSILKNSIELEEIDFKKNPKNISHNNLKVITSNVSQSFENSLKLRKSTLKLKLVSNFKMKTNQKNSIKLGLCFRIRQMVCPRRYIDKSAFKLHEYLKRYLTERLDVIHYISTLNTVHRIRIVLFNYYQNLSFDFLKIPNLANKSDLETLDHYSDILKDTKFNELIDYYADKYIKNQMSRHDEILYELIDPQIKEKVESYLQK